VVQARRFCLLLRLVRDARDFDSALDLVTLKPEFSLSLAKPAGSTAPSGNWHNLCQFDPLGDVLGTLLDREVNTVKIFGDLYATAAPPLGFNDNRIKGTPPQATHSLKPMESGNQMHSLAFIGREYLDRRQLADRSHTFRNRFDGRQVERPKPLTDCNSLR